MQSMKTLLSLSFFMLLFLGGLLLFYSLEPDTGEDSLSSLTPKAGEDEAGRKLELSEIKNKTEAVSNEPSALFNDPAINQAWGLKRSDAARAWSVSQGSRDIIVAVIDTGIDPEHEDLKENLWKNPGESGVVDSAFCKKQSNPLSVKDCDKSRNGKDDDKNGLIDDLHGWNFVSNDNSLTDNHGHGTHIAGIIGSIGGNGKGIIGISPNVSLMILKYYDPKVSSTDNLKNTIQAIRYAIDKGAQIINYSGGGTDYSQEEFEGVRLAEKKGILFVAAAGNERSNSDQFHYYPADYKLKNIISVTAVDPGTQVLSSSNYGIETVHIAAPGQNILSTLPGSSYGYMTGTSQATAFVSGAAALVMAHRRSFDAEDVRKYILATGDSTTQLRTKTKTSRILNLYKTLTILDQGVTASGGKPANTANFKEEFLSEERPPRKDSSMLEFGKGLRDVLQKAPKAEKDARRPAP